ncbi:MAG: hypothetical protein LBF22_05810 [Deltaproteobacteria bacterium]|jgi:hypothetical protein|nr:hypothetical protein [Deltaproteobacteria bacterium]
MDKSTTENQTIEIKDPNFKFQGFLWAFNKEFGIVSFINQILPRPNPEVKTGYGELFLNLLMRFFHFDNGIFLTEHDKNLHDYSLWSVYDKKLQSSIFNYHSFHSLFEAIGNYGSSTFFTDLFAYIYKQNPKFLNLDTIHVDIKTLTIDLSFDRDKFFWIDDFYSREFSDQPLKNDSIVCEMVPGYLNPLSALHKTITFLLYSNSSGIPVYFAPTLPKIFYASSQESNIPFTNSLKKLIPFADQKTHFTFDSTFYFQSNITSFSNFFISAVPKTIPLAKRLLSKKLSMTLLPDNANIAYSVIPSNLYGVPQRWIVIKYRKLPNKIKIQQKKLIQKSLKNANYCLKLVQIRNFKSQARALKRGLSITRQFPLVNYKKFDIYPTKMYSFPTTPIDKIRKNNRTKPIDNTIKVKKNSISFVKYAPGRRKIYDINKDRRYRFNFLGTLEENRQQIKENTFYLKNFIIATNDMTTPPEQIVQTYLDRCNLPRGFRFLKNTKLWFPSFFIDNLAHSYAFTSFLTFVLFTHSLFENRILSNLKTREDNPLFKKSDINRSPSLPRIFKIFNILDDFTPSCFYHKNKNSDQLLVRYDNNPNFATILKALGPDYEKFYHEKIFTIPLKSSDKKSKQ